MANGGREQAGGDDVSFGSLAGGARLVLLAALALGFIGLASAAAEAKRIKIRTGSEPGGTWLIDRATVAPMRREEAATATAATTPGRAKAARARARAALAAERTGADAAAARAGEGGGEAARHRPRGRRRLHRRLLSQRLGLLGGTRRARSWGCDNPARLLSPFGQARPPANRGPRRPSVKQPCVSPQGRGWTKTAGAGTDGGGRSSLRARQE